MCLKSFFSFSLLLWATDSWTIFCIKFKIGFVPLCEEATEAPPLHASVWNDSVIAGLLVVAPLQSWDERLTASMLTPWSHLSFCLFFPTLLIFLSPSLLNSVCPQTARLPHSHAFESICTVCKDTFLFWSKRPSREVDACWFVPGLLMCTGASASLLPPLKLQQWHGNKERSGV